MGFDASSKEGKSGTSFSTALRHGSQQEIHENSEKML